MAQVKHGMAEVWCGHATYFHQNMQRTYFAMKLARKADSLVKAIFGQEFAGRMREETTIAPSYHVPTTSRHCTAQDLDHTPPNLAANPYQSQQNMQQS